MADDRPITPEKQLLKLIEDPAAAQAAGQGRRRQKAAGSLSIGALRGAFFGRFSFFRRTARQKMGAASKRFSLDLAVVNRILAGAVVAVFFYVVGDAVASAVSLRQSPNFIFQKEKTAAEEPPKISSLKESAYYLEKVNSRDIFKEAGQKSEEDKSRRKEAAPAAENEAVKSLSLVGISWSSNPDVIIEDKSKQRTYFVKRGQMVGDNVKVTAVFKDKVVLSHDGEEFELK